MLLLNKKKITREFSKDFHRIFICRLVLFVIDDAQLCRKGVRGLDGVEQGNNLKTFFTAVLNVHDGSSFCWTIYNKKARGIKAIKNQN